VGLVNHKNKGEFMFYEFTKQEANRAKIKELCPNVQTVGEVYANDIAQINIICRELECTENDLLLTYEEYYELNCYEYR
jgi:DNA-binding Xre family transcriptional regulator